MAERLTRAEIETHLTESNSYNDGTKRRSRAAIADTILRAYLEADEAAELRAVADEQVRTLVRLRVRVAELEEELRLRLLPTSPDSEVDRG